MSASEVREYDWPALTQETQIIPPRGFSTPADREKRRKELRSRPTPPALRPPR
jgi:hypothetical protein